MRRAAVIAGAVLLLSLTACASGAPGEGGAVTESTPPTQPASTLYPSSSSSPLAPGIGPGQPVASGDPSDVPPARWDAIVADLAERGVTGEPELVAALAVTWSSGALGCGKPGETYTQALVDGMQVIVTADGTTYDYRFGQSDTPVLCT